MNKVIYVCKNSLKPGGCLPLSQDYINVDDHNLKHHLPSLLSIQLKFHVGPPWEGGTKVCINCQGHMTRWPQCQYMVEILVNILLQYQKSEGPVTSFIVGLPGPSI